MTGNLIKRGNLEINPCTGRYLVHMKAEIRVILLQTKELQTLPANHRKLGDKVSVSEGTNTADNMILDFWFLEL